MYRVYNLKVYKEQGHNTHDTWHTEKDRVEGPRPRPPAGTLRVLYYVPPQPIGDSVSTVHDSV